MVQFTARERRHQRTKQAILRAARELITEKGASGLSLRALARRIDYSPAGLYEYFGSKDEIITAVRGEAIERLGSYLNKISPDLPPNERLLKLGLAYLEFARREPEHFMLIFNTTVVNPVSFKGRIAEETPYKLLIEAIQVAIDAGEFKLPEGIGREQIAYSLWSLIHGMAMLQQTMFRQCKNDLNPVQQWAIHVFTKGLEQCVSR